MRSVIDAQKLRINTREAAYLFIHAVRIRLQKGKDAYGKTKKNEGMHRTMASLQIAGGSAMIDILAPSMKPITGNVWLYQRPISFTNRNSCIARMIIIVFAGCFTA